MVLGLEKLVCAVMGHDPTPPEMLDADIARDVAVVSTWCRRCGAEMLGEIPATDFVGDTGRTEGPWDTEPCLFCRREVLRSQTTMPEMWPCAVVCPECRGRWEAL